MQSDTRPLGFTWTLPYTYHDEHLAGVMLTHGREVRANPGGHRAIQFAPLPNPPGHPWAEGGRYEYTNPVLHMGDFPLLESAWDGWAKVRGKGEVLEVFTGPRSKPAGSEEAVHDVMMSTLARAQCMTDTRLPKSAQWGIQKVASELGKVGLRADDLADYRESAWAQERSE
jgi:hypothetical protein